MYRAPLARAEGGSVCTGGYRIMNAELNRALNGARAAEALAYAIDRIFTGGGAEAGTDSLLMQDRAASLFYLLCGQIRETLRDLELAAGEAEDG